MENRYILTMDFKKRTINDIQFKQGDVDSSILEVILMENGIPLNITGQEIEFVFLKSDGNVVTQDLSNGVSILNPVEGNFQCILNNNVLSTLGVVRCEITFKKYDGVLSTSTFTFAVNSSIGYSKLSINYISSIEDKLTNITIAESLRVIAENTRVITEDTRANMESIRQDNNTDFKLIEVYNNTHSYVPLNKVTYQGSTYQNILACTDVLPTDATKWILIALAGSGTNVINSTTNGNIKVNGTETKVYDDSAIVSSLEDKATQIQDIAINVRDYGAIGNGIVDDTISVQNAFNASNGKRLEVPSDFNCLITNQINIPDNIIVNCKGQFTCTGDEDYWFYSDTPSKVIIENIKATITRPFASRVLLNRVIVCNTPTYFNVKVAEIIGASTAIHCIFGDDFICGDIILRNVFGVEAQYGYGINSSAKRATIHNLNVFNDDTTQGRHAIYINGGIWENVVIDNIYVKNWNKNPINISNTDVNAQCNLSVKVATFVNANIVPTDVTTGCIHGIAGNAIGVRIRIESLRVKNVGGSALATTGGCDGLYLGNLYAEDLPIALFANTYLVYARYGSNHQIGKVFCTGLNTNWLAGVSLRDTINSVVDDVNIKGALGGQALRLNNAIVTIGNIKTESIDKIYSTGSTVTYKQLFQNFSYGGAIPTTGTWKLGDIIWETNPTLGGQLGWVCVTTGTPGTWNAFGILGSSKLASQADSLATDVTTLKTDFNALLAKLRTSKMMP